MYVRTCRNRLDTTTKFMVVVTSLFNRIISLFLHNMFYHAWTWLLIYYDGSNNVVQVCSFMKRWIIWSNVHKQACQQHCSSWPAQPCSSLSTASTSSMYGRIKKRRGSFLFLYSTKYSAQLLYFYVFKHGASVAQSCTHVKTHSLFFPVDRLEHGWVGQF